MASQKLTALTALTTPDPADLTYIVDDVAGTPVERKITLADLAKGFRTVVCSGQSLTGSQADSLVSLAATWNTTGTPTAFLLNVTDTASNANSLLMALQIGGANILDLAKSRALRLYNTADAGLTNFERGFMRWSSNVLQVGTEAAGTGTARELHLQTAGVTRLQISATNSNITTGNSGSLSFLNSSGASQVQLTTTPGFLGLHLATGGLVTWGSGTNLNGTQVLGLAQAATGILTVTNGTTGGASLEFREQTAPAAPSTDNVRIYAEDNGSGKTRLMARFATGAAQQIAIEP